MLDPSGTRTVADDGDPASVTLSVRDRHSSYNQT